MYLLTYFIENTELRSKNHINTGRLTIKKFDFMSSAKIRMLSWEF
jgi:spore germination protein GerM